MPWLVDTIALGTMSSENRKTYDDLEKLRLLIAFLLTFSGKDELSSIQQQLQHLKISPYAKINILQEENVGTQQTNEARQCQDASTTCQHQSPAYNNAVGQVDVTQGMRHDAAFTCFNPESSQQSLDNSTSFLSSPSSSNSSSDLNPENIGALTLRKDFGKRGFLQHSSHQVSFASFANQQEHLVQEQHVAQQAADQSQLMKLANVDYKTDGLIEASDLVRTLGPGSTGSFESQLSTSSLPGAGAAGLRFSQTVWQGGGSESTVEQINESSVTDPLSCLTPTATVELFNELERYSDLYPY